MCLQRISYVMSKTNGQDIVEIVKTETTVFISNWTHQLERLPFELRPSNSCRWVGLDVRFGVLQPLGMALPS